MISPAPPIVQLAERILREVELAGLVALGLSTAVVCCTVASKPKLPPTVGLIWTGTGEAVQAVAA